MVKIALILPGSTDYDTQGRLQGSLNVPLNEEGLREVAQLETQLRPLKLEVIYSSDCEHANQTADELSEQLGIRHKKLDRMQNICYGLWQGMLLDDVKHKQPKVYRQWQDQPESICPPDGETVNEARERVQACLSRLVKRYKTGVIGLVVPEPLASLVRVYLGQGHLGDLWRANASHGRWELIEVAPEVVAHSG